MCVALMVFMLVIYGWWAAVLVCYQDSIGRGLWGHAAPCSSPGVKLVGRSSSSGGSLTKKPHLFALHTIYLTQSCPTDPWEPIECNYRVYIAVCRTWDVVWSWFEPVNVTRQWMSVKLSRGNPFTTTHPWHNIFTPWGLWGLCFVQPSKTTRSSFRLSLCYMLWFKDHVVFVYKCEWVSGRVRLRAEWARFWLPIA